MLETISPGFVAGTLFGAVSGVAVDRIWRLVEGRVRIDIWPSAAQFAHGGRLTPILTVRNAGESPLPPYNIGLFNPHRGTISMFECESKEEQRPQEERRFTLPLDDKTMKFIRGWLVDHDPSITDPVKLSTYALRLNALRMETPIYENWRVGTALAAIFDRLANGGLFNLTWEESKNLTCLTWRSRARSRLKHRRDMREHRRQVRYAEQLKAKKHGDSQQSQVAAGGPTADAG